MKSVHAVSLSIINFFEEYPVGLFVPAFYRKMEGLASFVGVEVSHARTGKRQVIQAEPKSSEV